jgi:hypothetical protein
VATSSRRGLGRALPYGQLSEPAFFPKFTQSAILAQQRRRTARSIDYEFESLSCHQNDRNSAHNGLVAIHEPQLVATLGE